MIKGSIVDLITPTHSDGSPDYEILETLVEWHIDNGSSALIVASAVNQSSAMHIDERTELLRRAIWQSDGRIDVIADLSSDHQEHVLAFAAAADEFGADAVLLRNPTSPIQSQDALFDYFRAVIDSAKRPLIIGDDFTRPNLLSPPDILTLANTSGVGGFVNYSKQPLQIERQELPAEFALYSGNLASAYQSLCEGYSGIVSIVANIAPALVQKLCSAVETGDTARADLLNARLQPLVQALLDESNVIPIKWALIEMGCIPEGIHPPVLAHTHDYSNLRRAIRAAHIPI
ncbi:dihydrodipicolinate synthase family protein [Zhongshania sp.]|jgi:4-hydroxy-tetrahydrodipicolinate synthase|uniref:dihydrodipicolinate synthase family protein n=1 Tax=Zhongshania sp. TaxID=1971902 RepID=UPI001B45EF3F|nr:dihydrodipicolinate synthase family protein [Zhongshania sp.]MBQ0797380.1 dihydrodipicolinate synthase family protein [Zhongshania sp.]